MKLIRFDPGAAIEVTLERLGTLRCGFAGPARPLLADELLKDWL